MLSALANLESIMIGQTVSHFRILEILGEGAMGIVYHAEDTQLRCTRAIKFLSPHSLETATEKKRFLNEARAAADLHHSAICNVYEVGEHNGRMFLVMEFLAGATLRQRIARGPLDLREALLIAIQVAEGLQEAHDQGVVHRDIKPTNIMVTEKSLGKFQAKIMDFGLALLPGASRMTRTGFTVGTVAYMSPEQESGSGTDQRTDLWSLGVVLYEMVTGRLPFTGDNESAMRHAIRSQTPDSVMNLRPDAPPELEAILNKAMAKNPAERYPTAAELLQDLRKIHQLLEPGQDASSQLWTFKPPGGKRLLRTFVALLAIVAGGAIWLAVRPRQPVFPVVRQPRQVTSAETWEGDPCISPDGTRVAYASHETGNFEIYVVDCQGGKPIQLTDHPASDRQPAWFPDGSSLAFVSDRTGSSSIWKTGQLGGGATLLVPDAFDPAVSPDGRQIAFTKLAEAGEYRIAKTDLMDPAEVVWLTDVDDGFWSHSQPAWSPDGLQLCYGTYHDLWLVPSAGGPSRKLTQGGWGDAKPVWSPGGEWIYFASYRENTLALWRVDVDGGEPVRLTMGTGPECHPSISRDGTLLAYSTQTEDEDLIILDRVSGQEQRLPGLHTDTHPALLRDGRGIIFVSDRWGGDLQLWWQSLADGVPRGEAQRLTDHEGNASHPTVSYDGKWIAYYRIIGEQRDIWVIPTAGGLPVRITDHPAADIHPAWSPDGSQLAFASDREGHWSLYAVPVAGGQIVGPCRQITGDEVATYAPVWSPDGQTIAFLGYQEDQPEAWIVSADGGSPARILTKGAQANRLRWCEPTGKLWVSGLWQGRHFEIREVSCTDGRVAPIAPPVAFGPLTQKGMFDLSADAHLVVFCRVEPEGNVWVVEAKNGVF